MTRRPNRAVTATAVAALTASTALATLVTSAGPATPKAVGRGGPHAAAGRGVSLHTQRRWFRGQGKLVVVWAQDVDTSHQSIHTRILGTNAKPVGAISTVVTGWSSVSTDPTVLLL